MTSCKNYDMNDEDCMLCDENQLDYIKARYMGCYSCLQCDWSGDVNEIDKE